MAIPAENGDMCDSEDRDLTFSDLCSYVESLDSSLDFAIKTRILPPRTGLNCTQCQAIKSVVWMKRLSHSKVPFILFCKGCRKTISLCRNTVLSGNQVSVKQFFQCTYCWLLGLSAKECAAQSSVNLSISQSLYSLNQEICYILLSRNSQVLGGNGLTVEIGDAILSRRKTVTRPGQKPKVVITKDLVYIGHCIDTKETFLLKVEKVDLNTLLEIIMVMVLPESKIIIDGCQKYSEFVVENYDISFHVEELGKPNKIEPQRLKFTGFNSIHSDPALNLIQQLYFKKKPKLQTASQRFYPFIEDLVKVYPGYGKTLLKPLNLQEFISKTKIELLP